MAKRVGLEWSHQRKRINMRGDGCVHSLDSGGAGGPFRNTSDRHDVDFKYLTILLVNYTSVKLWGKKRMKGRREEEREKMRGGRNRPPVSLSG